MTEKCSHCNKMMPIDKLSTCVNKGTISYECNKPCMNENDLYTNEYMAIGQSIASFIYNINDVIEKFQEESELKIITIRATDIEKIYIDVYDVQHPIHITFNKTTIPIYRAQIQVIYVLLTKLRAISVEQKTIDVKYLDKAIKHFDYVFKDNYIFEQIIKIKDDKILEINKSQSGHWYKRADKKRRINIVFCTKEEEEEYRLNKEQEKLDIMAKYEQIKKEYEEKLIKFNNLDIKNTDINKLHSIMINETNELE